MPSDKSISIFVVVIFPSSSASTNPFFWAVLYHGVSFLCVKLINSLAVQYLNLSATCSSSSISLSLNSSSENSRLAHITNLSSPTCSLLIYAESRFGSSLSSTNRSLETGPNFQTSNRRLKTGIPNFLTDISSIMKMSFNKCVFETCVKGLSFWQRKTKALPSLSISLFVYISGFDTVNVKQTYSK